MTTMLAAPNYAFIRVTLTVIVSVFRLPVTMSKKVVFPDPEGPMMPIISPGLK